MATLQLIKQEGIIGPSLSDLYDLMVDLPPTDKKTLIFDLDETLIHTVNDPYTDACDLIIDIHFASDGETIPAGINIRPFVTECLKAAADLF